MSQSREKPKILIVLDLDETLFDSNRDGVTWLGRKETWKAAFTQITQEAADKGVDVVFTIVTNKTHVDDITIEALRELQEFLQLNNPHMYAIHDGKPCALVQFNRAGNHDLRYEELAGSSAYRVLGTTAFSNVVINQDCKMEAINYLKDKHQITRYENIVFMDDKSEYTSRASLLGVQVVSAQCFNADFLKQWRLKDIFCGFFKRPSLNDYIYVADNVERLQGELKTTVSTMINRLSPQQVASAGDTTLLRQVR